MVKLLVGLVVLQIFAILGSGAAEFKQNVNVKVVSSEKINDFLKQYPNAIKLSRKDFNRKQESDIAVPRNYLVQYTIGGRVNGDYLVAYANDNNSWGSPQNVQVTLTYPSSGTGNILSYVEFTVLQSNTGDAYIISGGIGQRQLTVVLVAYNTYVFNYVANYYGY